MSGCGDGSRGDGSTAVLGLAEAGSGGAEADSGGAEAGSLVGDGESDGSGRPGRRRARVGVSVRYKRSWVVRQELCKQGDYSFKTVMIARWLASFWKKNFRDSFIESLSAILRLERILGFGQ